jgi:hypothetical protein
MNILHEKRRALGYMAMGGKGDGGGGGGGETRDTTPQSERGPLSGDAFSNMSTPSYSDDGSMSQTFSMPEVVNTPADIATNIAAYNAQNTPFSTASNPTERGPLSGEAFSYGEPLTANTKPGEDFMSRYSATETYNDLTPAENLGMARALQLPAGENYTYDFNDPGIREWLTRATMPDSDSLAYRLGMRGAGTTTNQFFSGPAMGGETEVEKNDRMKLIDNGLHSLSRFAASLAPFGGAAFQVADLISGKSTLGGFLTNLAMTAAGKSLGVAPSVLSNMLEGNLGGAAKSAAIGALNSSISKSSGLLPAITASIGKATGATDAVGNAISSAISNTTGDTSTGFSTKSLASAIDGSLGNFGYTGGPLNVDAGLGRRDAGGNTTTPTNTNYFDPVDQILNPRDSSSTSPVAPTSTPTKVTPTSSVSTPSSSSFAVPVNTAGNTANSGADIGYYYDVGGDNIFAPKKDGYTKPDIIKYLQNNVATAAQGGSIDDLLNYVRK